jgi:hypothetical protein
VRDSSDALPSCILPPASLLVHLAVDCVHTFLLGWFRKLDMLELVCKCPA